MDEAILAISLVWLFVFIYAILGSVDFGTGFWGMVYTRKGAQAGSIANRFLSPTWEVTNVFLVLLVVTLVAFFPAAIYSFGMALLIPGSLVLILLTIRSTFMVFHHSVQRFRNTLDIVSGVTGVLIPSLLVSVLPILTGGFIDPETRTLRIGKLFTSPVTCAYLAFGLSSELFLSAAFLADYSREADNESTYRVFRRHVVWLGPLTLATAVLTTFLMGREAVWLRDRLLEERLWFFLSFAAFLIGYLALFWKSRDPGKSRGLPRLSFTLFITQYALASFAYGRAHLPYLVYPDLTVAKSVTNPEMFRYLLVSYAIGLAILVPGFYLFWRLFLKDKRYLHQR
ncbi:cytochrome bd-I ubiquinol oxidase subunit 2 apoprotein [Melghirimyces profundicolus]|uniref:Cytochrome bd-I ubiquinol oxidase subunit 2 apoprotein n=1 Tax=Melghirimyces profundicolus TaxID=1242148 RepID=A0A2T6C4U6_9BACL|nr:cytochrome d ubiquinol oxidase subunit II [Melghirimyces profundicolus]PTX63303.1 cytochrome bd-I ubiquinol oxidase subunit 2 apoprotein [Melghirimyces profundicolus]